MRQLSVAYRLKADARAGRTLDRLLKSLSASQMVGVIRACILRTGVRLRLRSLWNEDLSRTDVVFLYLFPELLERLRPKLDRELKPGAWVVSQTFGFKGLAPEKEIRVPRMGSEISVYLYRWKRA